MEDVVGDLRLIDQMLHRLAHVELLEDRPDFGVGEIEEEVVEPEVGPLVDRVPTTRQGPGLIDVL